eukprot:896815-Karenia_brevis.AAC.1
MPERCDKAMAHEAHSGMQNAWDVPETKGMTAAEQAGLSPEGERPMEGIGDRAPAHCECPHQNQSLCHT